MVVILCGHVWRNKKDHVFARCIVDNRDPHKHYKSGKEAIKEGQAEPVTGLQQYFHI